MLIMGNAGLVVSVTISKYLPAELQPSQSIHSYTLGPAWDAAVSDANDEKVLYPSWLHESGVQRRRHTASELCPLSPEWVCRCTGRVTMRRPQQIRVNRGVVYSIRERTQYRPDEDAKISKSLTRTNQVSHYCLDKPLLHAPHS